MFSHGLVCSVGRSARHRARLQLRTRCDAYLTSSRMPFPRELASHSSYLEEFTLPSPPAAASAVGSTLKNMGCPPAQYRHVMGNWVTPWAILSTPENGTHHRLKVEHGLRVSPRSWPEPPVVWFSGRGCSWPRVEPSGQHPSGWRETRRSRLDTRAGNSHDGRYRQPPSHRSPP